MIQLDLPVLSTKRAVILIGILALLVICATYSLNLLLITVSMVLTYKIITPLLNIGVFNTRALRAVFVFFIYIIILQCVILSSWVLNRNFPLDATPALTVLVMTIAYVYRHYLLKVKFSKEILPSKKVPLVRLGDIISIVVAILITLLIILPPLISTGAGKTSNIIALTSGNVDDAAHLGLLNDRLQFNRGVLYHSDATENVRTAGLYPAGWHSANAIIIKAIDPTISTGTESLIAYTISKVFWFFVLIFVFSRVIFTLYKTLSNDEPSLPVTLWLTFGSLLFSILFLVDIFRTGFYSFIPQLIAALLLVPILIQLSLLTNESKKYQGTLLLLVAACIGGGISWLLVLPALLLAIFLILLDHLRSTKLLHFIKDTTSGVLDNLPLYGLLLVALIVQAYVMLADHSTGSVSFIQGVLLSGGIGIYKDPFYLFIFIGLALCLLLFRKNSEKAIRYILYVTFSLLLFAGFLYVVQMIYLGKNAYYYYKALDVFTIVVIPIGLVGFALCIAWLANKRSKSIALAAALTLILVVIQFIGLDATSLTYLKGQRPLSGALNESVYTELKLNANQKNYNNKNYIVYYIPGSVEQNDISTMTVKSNKPGGGCFDAVRSSFLTYLTSLDFNNQLEIMRSSCQGYTFNIITDNAHVEPLRVAVQNMQMQNRVKIQTH